MGTRNRGIGVGLQPGAINVSSARRTWRSWSSALRFMESLLSLLRMHCDDEPQRARLRAGVPPVSAGWNPALPDRRDARPTFGFMDREQSHLGRLVSAHWLGRHRRGLANGWAQP